MISLTAIGSGWPPVAFMNSVPITKEFIAISGLCSQRPSRWSKAYMAPSMGHRPGWISRGVLYQ